MAEEFVIVEDRAEEPRSPWVKVLVLGCLGLAALGIAAIVALGFALESGYVPDIVVQEGVDVHERHVERLRDAGVLGAGEELLLFYSWGLFDALDGGSALTDDGLVTWWEDTEDGDRLEIDRVPWPAIMGATIETKGDFFEDSSIEVETHHTFHYALVTIEEDGDELFLARLLEEWETRGGHRPQEVPSAYEEAWGWEDEEE